MDHWDEGDMSVRWGVGIPPVVAKMETAGLHPIGEYIRRRQATIAEKVACRPIYELCIKVKRMPGTSRMVRWWDHDMIIEPEE